MPAGETTDEHKKWQKEETHMIEQDRSSTRGLFRGCFRITQCNNRSYIRDAEDGVDRCPECTWELEDGHCNHCGYDSDALYDSELADLEDEEAAVEAEDAALEMEEAALIEEGFDMDRDLIEQMEERGLAPPRFRGPRHADYRADYRLVDGQLIHGGSLEDSADDENDDDDEDEAGSLDDFIINDLEAGPASEHGSAITSGLWSTDEEFEEADIEGVETHGSDDDQRSHVRSASFDRFIEESAPDEQEREELLGHAQESSDTEMAPATRRRASRYQADPSNSDDDDIVIAMAAPRRRNRTWANGPESSNNFSGPRHGADYGHSETSSPQDHSIIHTADEVLEASSDSEAPIAPSRSRRRRPEQYRHPTWDNEACDFNGTRNEDSSGTATAGRISPATIPQRTHHARLVAQEPQRENTMSTICASNPSAPILIDSSPADSSARATERAGPGAFRSSWSFSEADQNSLPAIVPPPPANTPRRHHRTATPANQETSSSATLRSPLTTSRHRSRLASPFLPQSHVHSRSPHRSRSRSPSNTHRAESDERFEEGVAVRRAQKAARKAERRRVKAEREQRRRDQGEPSNAGGRPGFTNAHGSVRYSADVPG